MKWYQQVTKWMTGVAMIFAIVTVSIAAFAQIAAPPETVEGATALVPKLIAAIAVKDYAVAGGFALMILMVAFRQFALPKLNLSVDSIKYVMAIVSAISMAGLSMSNKVPALEATAAAVQIVLFASGLWEYIGKALFKKLLGDKFVTAKV